MIIHLNKYIPIVLLSVLFNQVAVSVNYSSVQSQPDTLNRKDQSGLKQGYWILYEKDGNSVLEKGLYKNNKKNGVWVNFYPNGNTKSKITYKDDTPYGDAVFYYENGKIREKGNWQSDHWVGAYEYYYDNGQLSYDWNYDATGKRSGEQKYFHANGTKMYEGNWEKGKTQGSLKVYNEKGILVEEKMYAEGKLTESVVKESTATDKATTDYEVPRLKFNGTGTYTIFNDNGTIDIKGYFVNGYLYNGEKFNYNKEGKLIYVTTYKNGEKAGTKNYSPK